MNKYKCIYIYTYIYSDAHACTYTYVNLTISAGTLRYVGQRKQKILESGSAGTSSVDVFVFEDARVNFSIA